MSFPRIYHVIVRFAANAITPRKQRLNKDGCFLCALYLYETLKEKNYDNFANAIRLIFCSPTAYASLLFKD